MSKRGEKKAVNIRMRAFSKKRCRNASAVGYTKEENRENKGNPPPPMIETSLIPLLALKQHFSFVCSYTHSEWPKRWMDVSDGSLVAAALVSNGDPLREEEERERDGAKEVMTA